MTDNTNTQDTAEEAVAEEVQAPKNHPSVDAVRVKFDNQIDFKPISIHFKTDKELGYKRPSFDVQMPVPSVEGLVEIFNNGGKGLELLQEAVQAVVYNQLRSQINDLQEKGGDINASLIDVSKLTWDFIANLSVAEKKSAAIPKETWDAFIADYVEVIVRVTGRELEKAVLAAKNLANKFAKIKGKKAAIEFLKGQLDIWFANSTKQEDFQEIYDLLTVKAGEALQEDEASLLENLGA